jgi:hypothetical protein
MTQLHRIIRGLAAILVVVAAVSPVFAQPAPKPPQGGGESGPLDQPGVSPAEIQRMFDAYALMQAQDQLKITDDQYAPFIARFKALQETRRKGQQERMRIIQDLRKLTAPDGSGDDTQIKERLKALEDADARIFADVRKAYDGVAQLLDAKQQARFVIFEEQMERRKVELVMRARQANRPKPPQKNPQ